LLFPVSKAGAAGIAISRAQYARYHPMLHSKVYFFELAGGTSTAFVGSHNLTRFALYGLNGEAGRAD
jgi:hypothetical protein